MYFYEPPYECIKGQHIVRLEIGTVYIWQEDGTLVISVEGSPKHPEDAKIRFSNQDNGDYLHLLWCK